MRYWRNRHCIPLSLRAMKPTATLIKHSFSPEIFQMGKNKLFVIFLLAFMIVGCVFDGGSKKKIVGNYYLWQWEGGRSYYLVDKHTSPNGGGLIDGTVQWKKAVTVPPPSSSRSGAFRRRSSPRFCRVCADRLRMARRTVSPQSAPTPRQQTCPT